MSKCCRQTTKIDCLPSRQVEKEELGFDLSERKDFSHEIELAFAWGLSSDSNSSPFDQLEREPRDAENEKYKNSILSPWDSDSIIGKKL